MEITLDTTSINEGDQLPTASIVTTPEDGAEVETTWTLEGEEVTSASTAGEYTATFAVKPNTGYVLADSVTYKVNNTEATADALTAKLTVNEAPKTPISSVEITLVTGEITVGSTLPVVVKHFCNISG